MRNVRCTQRAGSAGEARLGVNSQTIEPLIALIELIALILRFASSFFQRNQQAQRNQWFNQVETLSLFSLKTTHRHAFSDFVGANGLKLAPTGRKDRTQMAQISADKRRYFKICVHLR